MQGTLTGSGFRWAVAWSVAILAHSAGDSRSRGLDIAPHGNAPDVLLVSPVDNIGARHGYDET